MNSTKTKSLGFIAVFCVSLIFDVGCMTIHVDGKIPNDFIGLLPDEQQGDPLPIIVPRDYIEYSTMLSFIVQNSNSHDPIPLHGISRRILETVVICLAYLHDNNLVALNDFIDRQAAEGVFDLMYAANYLNIYQLLDSCCKKWCLINMSGKIKNAYKKNEKNHPILLLNNQMLPELSTYCMPKIALFSATYTWFLSRFKFSELINVKPEMGDILAFCFTPENNLIVAFLEETDFENKKVVIWDMTKQELLYTYAVRPRHILGIFSLDGKFFGINIMNTTYKEIIVIIDLATKTVIKTITEAIGYVNSIALSIDGKYLAVSRYNYNFCECAVNIWDITQDKLSYCVCNNQQPCEITTLCFSPDNKHLIFSAWDKTKGAFNFILTDICSDEKFVISKKNSYITSMSWSPDEKFFIFSGLDGTIRMWSFGAQALCYKVKKDAKLVSFSPDGSYFAFVGAWKNDYNRIHAWDMQGFYQLEKTFTKLTLQELFLLNIIMEQARDHQLLDLSDEQHILRQIYDRLPDIIKKQIEELVIL